MPVRDAAATLSSAVAKTLAELTLSDTDAGAVRLAMEYAALIDDATMRSNEDRAWALRWIGPLLLDVLGELGATPGARSRIKKGDKPNAATGQLAKLRAARQA